ncbi:MAG TPA: biopolymer transporter ExbD [Planctomycetota bacterium]|nr:biopolymer transporter ExbD [Planctomycetota bacterium]
MSDHGGDDDHGHGDKPWVFFAVDCFFLITQFFVITFKVKSDELALPQRLPPGGTSPGKSSALDTKKKLSVHVSRVNGVANYEFMSKSVNLQGLNDMLAGSVGGGQEYQVRVSYAADVPFGDVLAVFNSCAKVKIAECGLIPLRGNN